MEKPASCWFILTHPEKQILIFLNSLSYFFQYSPPNFSRIPFYIAFLDSCAWVFGSPRSTLCLLAGSELSPWQRSWGRRFGIRKGGIEPQESPWKFSSIYPPNQSLPTFCFVLLPTTSDFTGGCPPLPLSEKRVSLQLQLIIPGCDSVSTYKLLWKSSSLPE